MYSPLDVAMEVDMIRLFVNGNSVELAEDKKLIDLLRDDLKLTSVKDGCSEGACGACTVIVNGRQVKACVQKVSSFEGKSVITVEGLSNREKEIYAYCFAKAGAVQCGFCIPGMVLAAKSLLDINPCPTKAEVKKAIRGNICRCTGYKKIEEAILDAARYFRENIELIQETGPALMSKHYSRPDAKEKVLGNGKFTDDLVFPDMVYAKALRSKYPRAVVNKINLSEAERHPDTVKMLTAKDVPNNKIGHIMQDWDVMIAEGDTTRYIGDAIVLVASKRKESLDEIISLIEVDYTVLEPVFSPFDALRSAAPIIHPEEVKMGGNHIPVRLTAEEDRTSDFTTSLRLHPDGTLIDFSSRNVLTKEILHRGNAKKAIAESKYVVTKRYSTPFQEHAFLEPECAIALPEGEDGLLIYTGSQSVYDEQHEICSMLKLAPEKVRCHSMLVGGGFGGKEDMSVQHHAALMAWYTKCPVKVKFSRQESICYHTKRHAMEMEFTTACDENGILTGMQAVLLADTGAYASLGGPVLQRACTHAAGPYNYQNIDILGMSVYTNNVVGGAFRGFGVTQSCFATENNLNLLAELVGISPWEIRYRNAIRPGQVLPNGQLADESAGMVECLEALKADYESHPFAGIACGFKNSGTGVGLQDIGRVRISVERGKVHIRTSASCMGQGIAIMCQHMFCETTGLDAQYIIHEYADTVRTPNSGTSTASRQTVITGEAVRVASVSFKEAFRSKLNLLGASWSKAGSESAEEALWKKALEELEGEEFYGEYSAATDPMGSMKEHPVSHISYSYAAQVILLKENGQIEKVIAAYDVGTPVNIQSVEGQIEGGTIMGLGFALTEDIKLKNGCPEAKFGTLGLFRATETPDVEVRLVQGAGKIPQSYGAKGCGELCLIPTAPACSHAYYRLDGKQRTKLPLEQTYYHN